MRIILQVDPGLAGRPIAGRSALARMEAVLAAFGSICHGTPASIANEAGEEALWVPGLFPFVTAGLVQALRSQSHAGRATAAFPPGSTECAVVYLPPGCAVPEADNVAHALSLLQPQTVVCDPVQVQLLRSAADFAQINYFAFQMERDRLMQEGVLLVDPDSCFFETGVCIEAGVVIYPQVYIGGDSRIAGGTDIRQGSVLHNAEIGANVLIKPYSVLSDCSVAEGAQIGPFAHVRPGSRIGEDARVGNFVETKQVHLGARSKASHLTYLGDAHIGEDCNIGAGTITCNYDGVAKHLTTMGDRVFIGSGSQLVAPVTLGDGAYVAAGSTVTRNVPAEGLAIARSRQVTKENYAEKVRQAAGKKG